MNTITIVGRLGQDPEMRFTKDGKAVAEWSVATTRKIGDKEETVWHRCVAFGDNAEHYAGSFSKGRRVIVIGRLSIKEFDKKDGTKGSRTEIIVDEAGLSARFVNLFVENLDAVRQVQDRVGKQMPQQQSFMDEEEPF
jgi:single-strand DNA-binding protein